MSSVDDSARYDEPPRCARCGEREAINPVDWPAAQRFACGPCSIGDWFLTTVAAQREARERERLRAVLQELQAPPPPPPAPQVGRPAEVSAEVLDEMAGWMHDYLERYPDAQPRDVQRGHLAEMGMLEPKSNEKRMGRHHITLRQVRRRWAELWGV